MILINKATNCEKETRETVEGSKGTLEQKRHENQKKKKEFFVEMQLSGTNRVTVTGFDEFYP